MPERLDSISVLMWPTFCLTATEALLILPRMANTTMRKMGISAATTRASSQRMVAMTISAPMMVITEVSRSSGPWWASSVSSNRSEVRRLISAPVRLES